jgi:hypothetical protein
MTRRDELTASVERMLVDARRTWTENVERGRQLEAASPELAGAVRRERQRGLPEPAAPRRRYPRRRT